jgi:hypothetical protein
LFLVLVGMMPASGCHYSVWLFSLK